MFTATKLVVLLLALWSGIAHSQTGPQNASIPNCVRACDTQAIKASNCTSTDQYCHCIKYKIIYDNIVPCVQHNSTCASPTADLLTFEKLFDNVCQKFNLSVPTNVTGLTGNATTIPSSSPTPTPYISRASSDNAWPLETTMSIFAFVFTALYFCILM